MSEPSIFTRIIRREIPATIVDENAEFIAFNDISPQAPVHILVVPKTEAYANVVALAAQNPALLQRMIAFANSVAQAKCDGEFRLIFNTGEAAGQTVFHVHAHVLGGGLEEGTLGNATA